MSATESKLHEIAAVLFNHIDTEKKFLLNGMGLYTGSFGMSLFLAHYLHKYPNKDFELLFERYFEESLTELVSRPQYSFTHCSGLAGILTCLKLLNESSFIEIDLTEIEKAYYPNFWSWMNHCFLTGKYDFMHGALGVADYFRTDPRFIETALIGLQKSAVTENGKYKWISLLMEGQPHGYNICLSHGISSIIIFLSRIYQSGVLPQVTDELLTGSVGYVLSQEVDFKEHGCFFPSQSLENGDPMSKSRLAWCYGDLGVAAALWQAGKATSNHSWQDKAKDIYQFSAKRLSLEDGMVADAGLCHGTAGIAMMFSYMFGQTCDRVFLEARDYWVDQTLKMSRFADGPAGYKQFTMNENREVVWKDSFDSLTGITGIGFLLLSILDGPAESNLHRCYMLH